MDSFLSRTPSDRESSIAATIETASEIPDRQSLPSVESSTSTTPKRKRITTADATWQHTRKPQGSEPERAGPKQDLVFYCKYCSNPPYSTYVSTTFRNHLLKIHSVEAAGSEPNSTKKVRTSLIKEAFNKAGEIEVTKLQEREEQSSWLLSAISHAIAILGQSCTLCLWRQIILQKILSTPPTAMSKNSARTHMRSTKIFSEKSCNPHLPSFTSPLTRPGSHSGAEQWKLLQPVIEEYGISRQLGYITGDTHGSNDVLCRLLSHFLDGRGVAWNAR
ncbi:Uncharacterized protein HZ326_31420, partial [Fusarium oxysporum f. sp. albedinis]